MKKTLLIYLIMTFSSVIVHSQDTIKNVIYLTGKNTGRKIILRWAPGDAGTWHLSNHHGYKLERLEFTDSTDYFDQEYVNLVNSPIKPWPLEKWESIANKDSKDKYAAMAAQTIWGKRNKSEYSNSASFLEKSNEFENLYAINMLAADFSSNAALASGLRYEDNNIDKSKKYIYRLSSLANSIDYPIDTAYLLVRGNQIDNLEELELSYITNDEGNVKLQWKRMYNKSYSAYFIERSNDGGKTYQKLNESPYIDNNIDNNENEFFTYIDSVQNYIKYQYRIKGINTYAELSKPSNSLEGMGIDRTPTTAPQSINVEEIGDSRMKISWDMIGENPDLDGFHIARGTSVQGADIALTSEMLPKNTRSFIDTTYDKYENNWYYIYAIDTASNSIVGMPAYGAINDSVPPIAPTGLHGSIDSNGVVKIHWNKNKERDIYGYIIHYANDKDNVFINVLNKTIRDTIFIDTIELNVLTEEIYYKITAVDFTRNISEYSKILKIKKPDIVPPVPPVFTNYKITKEGIKLQWASSSSNDVKTHLLYRTFEDSINWKLIYRSNTLKEEETFIDTTTNAGNTYSYKILAQDDDGLFSESVYNLSLKAIDFSTPSSIDNLDATFAEGLNRIMINWQYPKEGKFKYEVFRAVNGGSFNYLRSINSTINYFTDNNIEKGNLYEYTIKVKYSTKKESGFSPIAKVDLTNINIIK